MDSFWKTVKLWSQKTHVVNKRLVGVAPIASWSKMSQDFSLWTDLVQLSHKHFNLSSEDEIMKEIENFQWQKCPIWTEDLSYNQVSSNCHLSLRKCLPKQPKRHQPTYELEFIDFKNGYAVYVPIPAVESKETSDCLVPSAPFCIKLHNSSVEIEIYENDERGQWILSVVLPKLNQWILEMDGDQQQQSSESLRLVSLESYNDLYHELKEKYVPKLMEIWPECTDPQKFIHEDVAIAAYLILIWRQDRLELGLPEDYRPSFLDIGCGNGLLVFLLSSEGYQGCGLDIRSRKLWSLYPSHVHLKVETLTPTPSTAFPQYDWLLGNHSDELTPWLPVMALNSSVQRLGNGKCPTRFWVLPCCPFSFWGKFQRQKSACLSSRYGEYLQFVEMVGQTCGFDVQVDRMRIPSTRRTCLVGKCSSKVQDDWQKIQDATEKLINKESRSKDGFQPRSAVEAVRNCTKVDRTIQDRIVDLTARFLLEAGTEVCKDGWNKGGSLLLAELVTLIGRNFDDFRSLKNECGGIQTLLKNHSHIFVVQNQCVRFRSPEELSAAEWRALQKPGNRKKLQKISASEQKHNMKTRQCWFHLNHPQGCPLNQESCRYLHQ